MGKSKEEQPTLLINNKKGIITLTGTSFLLNHFEFYQPLFKEINELINAEITDKTKPLYFILFLDDTDSKTFQLLIEVLRKLEELDKKGRKVHIYWIYENGDEDSFDGGNYLLETYSSGFQVFEADYNLDDIENYLDPIERFRLIGLCLLKNNLLDLAKYYLAEIMRLTPKTDNNQRLKAKQIQKKGNEKETVRLQLESACT